MESLPKLTSDNVASILQLLLAESTTEIEGSYIDNKARLAYLRQAIKVVELFIEHERYNAIETRLERLDGFTKEIRQYMISEEANEFIRSRCNGVLED